MARKIDDRSPASLFADELMAEKASALGRLGRGLEAALAALAAHDGARAEEAPDRTERDRLVAVAADALWMLMVQREACGLRDGRTLIRDYGVPAEVERRAGMVTPVMQTPGRGTRRSRSASS